MDLSEIITIHQEGASTLLVHFPDLETIESLSHQGECYFDCLEALKRTWVPCQDGGRPWPLVMRMILKSTGGFEDVANYSLDRVMASILWVAAGNALDDPTSYRKDDYSYIVTLEP